MDCDLKINYPPIVNQCKSNPNPNAEQLCDYTVFSKFDL